MQNLHVLSNKQIHVQVVFGHFFGFGNNRPSSWFLIKSTEKSGKMFIQVHMDHSWLLPSPCLHPSVPSWLGPARPWSCLWHASLGRAWCHALQALHVWSRCQHLAGGQQLFLKHWCLLVPVGACMMKAPLTLKTLTSVDLPLHQPLHHVAIVFPLPDTCDQWQVRSHTVNEWIVHRVFAKVSIQWLFQASW